MFGAYVWLKIDEFLKVHNYDCFKARLQYEVPTIGEQNHDDLKSSECHNNYCVSYNNT